MQSEVILQYLFQHVVRQIERFLFEGTGKAINIVR